MLTALVLKSYVSSHEHESQYNNLKLKGKKPTLRDIQMMHVKPQLFNETLNPSEN